MRTGARVLAHGIGGPESLPVPFGYALAGAGVALLVTFAVLGLAWREPRFAGDESGRPLPAALARAVDQPATRSVLRALVLAFTGYVAVAAVFGPDTLANPTFGAVYVLLWVGIVPVSLVAGPCWRVVNPLRTIHRAVARLAGDEPERPASDRLGLWPAAATLYSFGWLELVSPSATYLGTVRLWFAVVGALLLVGAILRGPGWFAAADPFEAYSTLVGRLAPCGRRVDGRLVVRNPLAGLAGLRPRPGLVAVVAVLLGSTAYDSLATTPGWLGVLQSAGLDPVLVGTLGLTGCCVVVAGTLVAATVLSDPRRPDRWRLPARYAHSVVPIVVGYVLAHYLALLVETGQQTLALLSDPLDRGWDVFGTADWQARYPLSGHPSVLAVVQVGAVVVGHVLGVVAAHDRAVRLLPAARARRGQLPLLAVMVGYTVTGLALLFAA